MNTCGQLTNEERKRLLHTSRYFRSWHAPRKPKESTDAVDVFPKENPRALSGEKYENCKSFLFPHAKHLEREISVPITAICS
jgi:hypothetical protein